MPILKRNRRLWGHRTPHFTSNNAEQDQTTIERLQKLREAECDVSTCFLGFISALHFRKLPLDPNFLKNGFIKYKKMLIIHRTII